MARSVPFRFLLTVLSAATAVWAQTLPAPAAKSPATSTAPAGAESTDASAAAPKRARAISSDVAAQLAASMPKPKLTPPPKPVQKVEEEDLPDLRDIDKPKNEIVRLPKVVVSEPRPPVFTERELNTPQQLKTIAMRRYFTEADRALNRFTLPLFAPLSTSGTSNEVRAMTMYEEDERLKNMSSVADQTNMVMKADPAAGAKLKNDAQQTFMRWSDFGRTGTGGK